MKIADVIVGTEYAAVNYGMRNSTEWEMLDRCHRVLVTSIEKGGKVMAADWDREAQAFRDKSYEKRAANLIMPWAEAVPKLEEIQRNKIARAEAGRKQVAREQEAFRRLAEILDQEALDLLPYSVAPSIALAHGDEGKDPEQPWKSNRHEPKISINVITLVKLLEAARGRA